MRFERMRTVAGLYLTLALAAAAHGADWPGWRGPDRTGRLAGIELPTDLPARLERVWTLEIGTGHSSPIASGTTLFVFSRQDDQEVVRAIGLADGAEIWKQSYAAPYKVHFAALGHGSGPKSTPCLAGGRLYTLGISGIASCWDVASGERLWQREFSQQFAATSPNFGAAMSPLVDGDVVYLHVGGHDAGAFVAVDAATGKTRWSWEGDGPGYASPVIATLGGKRQVITQSQKYVLALDAARGKPLWQVPLKTPYDQNSVTPIVHGDTVIYSGIDQGITAARPVESGGAWTADEVWHTKEVSLYMSTPVAVGDRLIGFSHMHKGELFALDPATGATIWKSDGRQGENASLLAAGSTILALTNEAKLIAFDGAAGEYTVLAERQISELPIWAHPLMSDGFVVVKDQTHVSAWR